MMRLIDAAETAEVISNKFDIPMFKLVDVFAKIPSVEYPKGEWIDAWSGHGRELAGWCCSKCKKMVPLNTDYSFCPNCGADMKGNYNEEHDS